MNTIDAAAALAALNLATGKRMTDYERNEFLKIALESEELDELIAFSEKMFEKYEKQNKEKKDCKKQKAMYKVEAYADKLKEDNQAVIVSVLDNDLGHSLAVVGHPALLMDMILDQAKMIISKPCCKKHLEEFKQDMAKLLLEGE